jgi:hypothetical protein
VLQLDAVGETQDGLPPSRFAWYSRSLSTFPFIQLIERLLNLDNANFLDLEHVRTEERLLGEELERNSKIRTNHTGTAVSDSVILALDYPQTTIAPWHPFGNRRLMHLSFREDSIFHPYEIQPREHTERSQSLMSALIFLLKNREMSCDSAYSLKCTLIHSDVNYMELEGIRRNYVQYHTTHKQKFKEVSSSSPLA